MSAYFRNHFWKWFEKYNKQYTQIYKRPKIEAKFWSDELAAHLKAYCKGLEFVLFFNIEHRLTQLVITAGGNCRYFKKVEALVQKAPVIPGWQITAFHQPRESDFMIEERYSDTGIDPNRLWFKPARDNKQGNKLGITVYSEMYRDETGDRFYEAVTEVVANILGEKSIGLNIDTIDLDNLSNAPAKGELLHLEELPVYVESMQLLFEVNEKGILKERGAQKKKQVAG